MCVVVLYEYVVVVVSITIVGEWSEQSAYSENCQSVWSSDLAFVKGDSLTSTVQHGFGSLVTVLSECVTVVCIYSIAHLCGHQCD